MKKILIICILSIILGMIVGFVAGHSVATSESVKYLEAYDAYNKATEELLSFSYTRHNYFNLNQRNAEVMLRLNSQTKTLGDYPHFQKLGGVLF